MVIYGPTAKDEDGRETVLQLFPVLSHALPGTGRPGLAVSHSTLSLACRLEATRGARGSSLSLQVCDKAEITR